MIKRSIAFILIFSCSTLQAATLQDNINSMDAINTSGVASQKKIEVLARETQDLQGKYRKLLNNTEYLQAYNASLQQLRSEQERQLVALQQQVTESRQQRQRAVAVLLDMVQFLEKSIARDPPFHRDSRLAALAVVRQQLAGDTVSLAIPYRSLWEAYESEIHYGNSIEAYRETLQLPDGKRDLNLLRIGRLALYYQSLDGTECGRWNERNKQWEKLPDTFNADIKQALLVANHQVPAQRVAVPMTAQP